ncbi:putative Rpc11-DNA-directed RNA polymerase III subunit C11 [Serendipita vermifera]|nr:putative Rpc11-DNA-directed RNA polymerase III subunit C11 [Serendipita vermifera]
MLIISNESTGKNKWVCQTCPYEFPITKTMKSRTHLKRKEVDDVLGGDESWGNQTNAPCPKCDHPMAHFMELQIRSADEPMTIFYKCAKKECGFQWKEN